MPKGNHRLIAVGDVHGSSPALATLIEAIRDPLTHLVRNAIDHGIEPPERRLAVRGPVSRHGDCPPVTLGRVRALPGHGIALVETPRAGQDSRAGTGIHRLELAQHVHHGRTTVDAKLLQPMATVTLHRLDHVARLERHRLYRSPHDVRSAAASREPDDRAACVRIPVRCAQAHEGRHQVDAARILN